MRMYLQVKNSKFVWLAFLMVAAFGLESSVYANNMESNQCAKLFEVQKQAPSFKDLIKHKIRAAQEAQNKSAAELQAEETKRKEEERQKREAMDPKNLGLKIKFVEIPPGIFLMGEGSTARVTEIRKAYEIMDKRMTQLMYARLVILMGYEKILTVFPSFYTDGTNSILYNFNGTEVSIRPDDPVTNVTWYDLNNIFIPKLNELSRSDDPRIQQILKILVPDHQKGDVYDLVTDAQMEYAMKLAKTADGDSIDAMVRRQDHEKLKKYVAYAMNSNTKTGTIPEGSLRPLFIDGKLIYLNGNVSEWMKDRWDRDEFSGGGQDPVVLSGYHVVARGGSLISEAFWMSSFHSQPAHPDSLGDLLGFRLARISRGSIHNNVGGTP